MRGFLSSSSLPPSIVICRSFLLLSDVIFSGENAFFFASPSSPLISETEKKEKDSETAILLHFSRERASKPTDNNPRQSPSSSSSSCLLSVSPWRSDKSSSLSSPSSSGAFSSVPQNQSLQHAAVGQPSKPDIERKKDNHREGEEKKQEEGHREKVFMEGQKEKKIKKSLMKTSFCSALSRSSLYPCSSSLLVDDPSCATGSPRSLRNFSKSQEILRLPSGASSSSLSLSVKSSSSPSCLDSASSETRSELRKNYLRDTNLDSACSFLSSSHLQSFGTTHRNARIAESFLPVSSPSLSSSSSNRRASSSSSAPFKREGRHQHAKEDHLIPSSSILLSPTLGACDLEEEEGREEEEEGRFLPSSQQLSVQRRRRRELQAVQQLFFRVYTAG